MPPEPALGPDEKPVYAGIAERIHLFGNRPAWLVYVIAAAITVLGIALRIALDAFGEDVVPFAVFFPFILACTLFGGLGAGLLSLAMCSLAAIVFWIEPRYTLGMSGAGLVNLVLFIATNGVSILVAQWLRTAHFHLRQNEARLNLAQDVGRIGIWDLDLKTGALWWSPALYMVTGISPDQPPSVEAIIRRIVEADRARVMAAFDAARQGINRLDVDFRFNRDDGTTIWLTGRAELFRDAQGRPSRLLGINFDATSIRTVESERDEASGLLRTFFDSLPGAAYVKDAEGRIMLGNPGFALAIGRPYESCIGQTDDQFVRNPEHARAIIAHDKAVFESGEAQQVEEDMEMPDGRLSHWLSVKTPFKDAEGRIKGLVGISLDVTERRQAARRLRFLADEVDHRAKNLLSIVLSIVRLTKVDDVALFKSALTGRIQALARAHNLLAASRWEGVDIAALVKEELAPFNRTGAGQIMMSGPSLTLEPNAAQALAMVLHELAINAASYGALSAERGRLTVDWKLSESSGQTCVELVWAESSGPAVAVPAKPGFGSTAVRGAIEHQLGGEIHIDWAPSGVTCRIAFPAARNISLDTPVAVPAPENPSKPASNPNLDLSGKRVLILDDEALVALTLREAIEEFGAIDVELASTTVSAMALIRSQAPDLAILDVNLAGVKSTPVARMLRELGVPFIYCTGYAEPAGQIDPGMEAETVTKPADLDELAGALKRAVAG